MKFTRFTLPASFVTAFSILFFAGQTCADTIAPTVISQNPAPGIVTNLSQVTVTFSEAVTNVSVSDLLLNGFSATDLTGTGDSYTFTFDQPAHGAVGVSWDIDTQIADLANPRNAFDTDGPDATWVYDFIDVMVPAAQRIHPRPGSTLSKLGQVEITFTEPIAGIDAADLLINGTPALSAPGSLAGPYLFQFIQPPSGQVELSWSLDHGIHDLASPSNLFTGGQWVYELDPNLPIPEVRINEVLAANETGLVDEDGERQDWIELVNEGDVPVNLAGMSLSDDPDDPGRWLLPDLTLGPGAYMIIFASGKDRRSTEPDAALHTDFKLGIEGEFIGLFNGESPRELVSTISYPEQRNDHSYGYTTGGNLKYFDSPTPGEPNGTSAIVGLVPPVQFSVEHGFSDAPFTLELSTELEGAIIRFTRNGSEPTKSTGQVYSGELTIDQTTILRAAAFKEDYLPSRSGTQTYFFLDQVIRQPAEPPGFPAGPIWGGFPADYEMDPEIVDDPKYSDRIKDALLSVPSLSIVMKTEDMFSVETGLYTHTTARGPEWERPCSVELVLPDGGEGFQVNCGIQIQGNSNRNPANTPKHGMRLLFKGEFGPRQLNYQFFPDSPVTKFNTLVLRPDSANAWLHWTVGQRPRGQRVRDPFLKDTLRDMGGIATRNRFVHLYINGLYWGLYDPAERPDAAYAASYLDGEREEYDAINQGQPEDGNIIAYQTMVSLLASDTSKDAQYQKVLEYLNLPQFIDYMIAHFYGAHGDWGVNKNWYAFRRRQPGSGFYYMPWDCERILESPDINRVISTGVPSGLHTALKRNAEYRLTFADHVHKHFFNNGSLTPPAVVNRWMKRANEVDKAMIGESARWGDYRRDVDPRNGASPLFERDVHYLAEQARLLTSYFPVRSAVVMDQLRNADLYPAIAAPEYSQFGGAVPAGYNLQISHANTGGTVLFTLDGSDPRLYGGDVSPSAQSYAQPVPLTSTVLVRARVKNGQDWSALTETTFFPDQDFSKLLITEIMYNPPDLGLIDGDEFEFVEFKNAGTNELSLAGLTFTSGITFTFATGTTLGPGAFLVLVRNQTQFAAVYPDTPVHGVYTSKLNNGGDTLTLSSPLGGTLLSVSYDDRIPWPITADGMGFSVVPVQPNVNLNPDEPANWRASHSPGGSPGSDDPNTLIHPIRINEALSRSESGGDIIELFNPTGSSVDLGNWLLTDDPTEADKFQIAPGTQIAPNSYLIFTEDDFNPTPGSGNSFALNAGGDEVYLFSGSTEAALTGYSHGFSFGASAVDTTFGRHVISTGEERFPAQSTPSTGQANTGPRVGPVVITEIMYHPDNNDHEFLELRNVSTNAVPLFDPAAPTNTWRINGLSYSFPEDLILAPSEWMLVVSIDPDLFRSRYNVSSEVRIVGPYPGGLQNDGERLRLQRPENLDPTETIYITVDEIRYNDKSPWPPAADGSGPSLQRKNLVAYGDDPANWEAANSTPGLEFPAGEAPTILAQPQSEVVSAGQTAFFDVAAAGPGQLSYQWQFKGKPIADGTNQILMLEDVELTQAGTYTVVVFNDAGSAISSVAHLTVNVPPIIVTQPTTQGARLGQSATFNVEGVGNGFLRYQWRFNGEEILRGTNSSLTVNDVELADGGSYSVIVRDAIGSVLSEDATLLVLIAPVIIQQPIGHSVVAGTTTTLSITVSNSATYPLSFRWRRNGRTMKTFVLNENTSFFTVTNVQGSDTYTVVVSNPAIPQGMLSARAVIVALEDGDEDGIADLWEDDNGLDSNDPNDGALDQDGDTMTNLEEYIAGTDHRDAASHLGVDQDSSVIPLLIQFQTISNRTYTLEWRESVDYGKWDKLVDVPARATNALQEVEDPYPPTDGRLYRLTVPRKAEPALGPIILRSPRSRVLNIDDAASLVVVALGTEPLTYQWFFNGNSIPGANAAELTFPQLRFVDGGFYTVQVSDQTGSVTNEPPAIIALRPQITRQPQSQSATVGQTVIFEVAAVGAGPLFVRWMVDGELINGQTESTLTLSNVQPADAGEYQAIVSQETPLGLTGTVSRKASLTVD